MKKLLFTLLLALPALLLPAQLNYAEAIERGDDAFRQGKYRDAINLYFAAEAFEPAQSAAVKAKVNAVFDRIEALLAEADRAKRQAEAALAATQQARLRTDSALQQANRLINAFYFYADRFALAYGEKEGQYGRKDRVFYFIDKNGEEVPKLGRWAGAEQFDGV